MINTQLLNWSKLQHDIASSRYDTDFEYGTHIHVCTLLRGMSASPTPLVPGLFGYHTIDALLGNFGGFGEWNPEIPGIHQIQQGFGGLLCRGIFISMKSKKVYINALNWIPLHCGQIQLFATCFVKVSPKVSVTNTHPLSRGMWRKSDFRKLKPKHQAWPHICWSFFFPAGRFCRGVASEFQNWKEWRQTFFLGGNLTKHHPLSRHPTLPTWWIYRKQTEELPFRDMLVAYGSWCRAVWVPQGRTVGWLWLDSPHHQQCHATVIITTLIIWFSSCHPHPHPHPHHPKIR